MQLSYYYIIVTITIEKNILLLPFSPDECMHYALGKCLLFVWHQQSIQIEFLTLCIPNVFSTIIFPVCVSNIWPGTKDKNDTSQLTLAHLQFFDLLINEHCPCKINY